MQNDQTFRISKSLVILRGTAHLPEYLSDFWYFLKKKWQFLRFFDILYVFRTILVFSLRRHTPCGCNLVRVTQNPRFGDTKMLLPVGISFFDDFAEKVLKKSNSPIDNVWFEMIFLKTFVVMATMIERIETFVKSVLCMPVTHQSTTNYENQWNTNKIEKSAGNA